MNESSGCRYFDQGQCRSCGLLPLPYAAQLKEKQRTLADAFARAGFDSIDIAPLTGAEPGFRTRTKTKMAVGGTIEHPIIGYAAEDYRIREIGGCPLYPEPIPMLLEAVRHGIREHRIAPYSIERDRGELKHIIIKVSETTGEASVRLVLRSRDQAAQARALLTAVQLQYPSATLLSINYQPVRTAIIEGSEEEIISKRNTMLERYADLSFPLSPQSFSQVTSSAAAKLYETAAQIVSVRRPALLLDLFCGVGTFALACAKGAGRIEGIELSPLAIENARAAAKLNNIENCEFYSSDALQFLKSTPKMFDGVVINPPRRGLGEDLSRALTVKAKDFILYSSCNPESLMKDLALLRSAFVPVKAFPFDMFPNTKHLEVLVLLEPSLS